MIGVARKCWLSKSFPGVCAVALLALGSVGLLAGSTAAAATTAPTLGKAAPFAVLAGSTVTNTGATVVSGDLGVYPGSAVTGFTTSTTPGTGTVVNGKQYKATSVAKTAQASLSVAYTDAAHAPSTQNVTGENLASKTLTAGVYTSTSSMTLTGTLTLSGTTSSVFIFQAASTLIAGTTSAVVLTGGVQACNVFWQVGSSATLKTGTKFDGTVMALTSASLTKTVVVSGRILAKTGAVTLLSDHVTVPTCSAPPSTTTTTTTTTATTKTTTAPSSTSVVLGASVDDVATVTGNTADGVPTGSVQFYQCGPGSTLCASTTGAVLTPAATLNGGVATSPSFTPSAIGTYCFAAVYAPASASPYSASSEAGTATNGECVTVTAAAVPVTTTTPLLPAASTHTAPLPATVTSATVPSVHTGEPWAGWLYWVLVAILGAVGIGLVADRARRHRLGRSDDV
jgi:hypothetical protein